MLTPLDLLHAIESSLQKSSSSVGEFAHRIPSAVTFEEALVQQGPNYQNLPMIAPQNATQAFELTNYLIAATSGYDNRGDSPSFKCPRQRCAWAIDALATLWSHDGLPERILRDCNEHCYDLALGMLRAFMTRTAAFPFDKSNSERAASTICCVMLALLLRVKVKPNTVLSGDVQFQLCRSMLEVSPSADNWPNMIQAYTDALEPSAGPEHGNNDVSDPFCQDLYRILRLVRSSMFEGSTLESMSNSFDDLELGQEAHTITRDDRAFTESARPSKRPRLEVNERITNGNAPLSAWPLKAEFQQIFGRSIEPGEDISKTAMRAFPDLPQTKQCALLLMVGKSACFEERGPAPYCATCDSPSQAGLVPAQNGRSLAENLYNLMLELVRMSQEQKHPPPRVAAMVSLKRLLIHTPCSSHLELKSSSLGQWCLQSLRSSVRELRLAAV